MTPAGKRPSAVRRGAGAPAILTGNAIGGIFGSAIGQAIGGGNVFARVGAQAALSTVLGALGGSLDDFFNDGATSGNLAASVAVSLNGVGSALGNNLIAAGSGALSSFLTAELAQTLGFNTTTFGGQLFSYVAGTTVTSVLSNVLASIANGAGAAGGPRWLLVRGHDRRLGWRLRLVPRHLPRP